MIGLKNEEEAQMYLFLSLGKSETSQLFIFKRNIYFLPFFCQNAIYIN